MELSDRTYLRPLSSLTQPKMGHLMKRIEAWFGVRRLSKKNGAVSRTRVLDFRFSWFYFIWPSKENTFKFQCFSVTTKFPYLVSKKRKEGEELRRVAQFDWHIIERSIGARFEAVGLTFTPLHVYHGGDYMCLGILFGEKTRIAYVSDVSRFPTETEHGEPQSVEEFWKEYFADPTQWWDNRADKRNKVARKALWIYGWSTPSWVKAMLKLATEGRMQPPVDYCSKDSQDTT